MSEVPGCKELLEQERQPVVQRSKEEIAAILEENERAQREKMDRWSEKILGSGDDDGKEDPVFPTFARQGVTLTPPHFPFERPTPRKVRARDARKLCDSPSSPLAYRQPFQGPTHKKLRSEKEGKDESKDEGKDDGAELKPTLLRYDHAL